MRYIMLCIVIVLVIHCDQKKSVDQEEFVESNHLAIKVDPQNSRPFVYSNNKKAIIAGETSKPVDMHNFGFYTGNEQILSNYQVKIDGEILNELSADSIIAYPDHLTRFHKQKINERLFVLNDVNCMLLEISSPSIHKIEFIPYLPLFFSNDNYSFKWQKRQNQLLIINENDTKGQYIIFKFNKSTSFRKNLSTEQEAGHAFCLGDFKMTSDCAFIAIAAGENKKEIEDKIEQVITNPWLYMNKNIKIVSQLLERFQFNTNLSDLNDAFQWAIISLDQLFLDFNVADTKVKGLATGLPSLCRFEARTSLYSLPGALLVTGRFEEAKNILLLFAQHQRQGKQHLKYGQIPDQLNNEVLSYNAIDAAFLFTQALWYYFQYTGDINFLREMFPVIEKSIEGVLEHNSDNEYFVTHDENDTWMNSSNNFTAFTPRGNRAVETQLLWYNELVTACQISKILGNSKGDRWHVIAENLQRNFNIKFWDSLGRKLYDHINLNGNFDLKVRPNQIFAVSLPVQPMLKPEHEFMVVKEVVSLLTYPYGVATLWQHDPDFYPYYNSPGFYSKDQACYNGTINCWLTGHVIRSLIKFGYYDMAFELLTSQIDQILKWGSVGTLSELLDAIPLQGKEIAAVAGATSHALSLAEFIQNIYQDFIGIEVRKPENKIMISPHLPRSINSIDCKIPLPSEKIFIKMRKVGSEFLTFVNYQSGENPLNIEFKYPQSATEHIVVNKTIAPGDTVTFSVDFFRKTPLLVNWVRSTYKVEQIYVPKYLFTYFSFAVPQIDRNLNIFKNRESQ